MRKTQKNKIIIACSFAILYIMLHSTPYIALRTYLFITGHPIISITTGIVDDEVHNRVDRQALKSQNAKCYSLTKPAFEKATQSNLRNYIVRKKGFLYFAHYYGEG